MSDQHEIIAIRYARADRRSAENFLGGDPHDHAMPMDYALWAIRGEQGITVVDTGFDQQQADERRRTLLTPVEEALQGAGIDHEDVSDVVLTHLHYDHAGNAHLFPNATFHVQEREMRYATGRSMTFPACAKAFNEEDVVTMVRRVFSSNVAFHDGDSELAPGISLHLLGGHTMGLQVVRINTARGPVVLASDAAHYYANLTERRAFPDVYNMTQLMVGYERLESLAPSLEHIIPGHDPQVFSGFPQDSQNPEVVRLDLEPIGPLGVTRTV